MNINDLKPASQFAGQFGVKCLAYGPPGGGKTPLINTAPRPVLLAVEPGLVSMRNSSVPTLTAFENEKLIREFFEWLLSSNEAQNYDTVCIDSVTQMAEIILKTEEKNNKHGLQAYGEMARKMKNYFNDLYYMKNKNVYLIAKQGQFEEMGVIRYRPYFPGKDLATFVPHLFDEVLRIEPSAVIPGVVGQHPAIRCKGDFNIEARDRSGKLNQFEPQDLSALFQKAMS